MKEDRRDERKPFHHNEIAFIAMKEESKPLESKPLSLRWKTASPYHRNERRKQALFIEMKSSDEGEPRSL